MAINKIIRDGTTLIDLTQDTVNASSVLSPKTFHLASGEVSTGTIPTKTSTDVTQSGSFIHVPAGYYANDVDKEGIATGDATAYAQDILLNKTAYARGEKLTGTCTYDSDTTDANASAPEILTTMTAYVNKQKIYGTMPNNGTISTSITEQGGTATIPMGYTSGGTVTANIIPSELSENIISGEPYEETTGDYGWKSTVEIPAGYHNKQTLTKEFKKVFPAPTTEAESKDLRLGKLLYDHTGKLVTGNMTEKSAATYVASLSDQTIAAEQFLAGAQTIKAVSLVADPTKILVDNTVKIQSNGSDIISTNGSCTYNADTSSDTVTAPFVLTGKTFHLANGTSSTGTCTYDSDTKDATAIADNITLNKTAYVNGSKVTGTMATFNYKWKKIDHIAIETAPSITEYNEGNALSITGLVVNAVFTDNTTKNITSDCTFTPAVGTLLTPSINKLKINYLNFEVDQNITVHAFTGMRIQSLPTKLTYWTDSVTGTTSEPMDYTGMVVLKLFDGGRTEETADYTVSHASGEPFPDSGLIPITITVNGQSESFAVYSSYCKDYLCFTATAASSIVKLNKPDSATWTNMQYSLNKTDWATYVDGNSIILANIGDKVYFRGNNTTISGEEVYNPLFEISGGVAASGNLNTLLSYTEDVKSLADRSCCFDVLFGYNCTGLVSAPAMPATTLSYGTYAYMFSGCTNLVTAPYLPATTLAEGCYAYMFEYCTSMTIAPQLIAMALVKNCYSYMFRECTALVTVPQLPATALAQSCYSYMFNGCTSLYVADASAEVCSTPWKIPTNGSATGNYTMARMFTGCLGTRAQDSPNFHNMQKTYYTNTIS